MAQESTSSDVVRITLGGDWGVEDFADYLRVLTQAYSLTVAFEYEGSEVGIDAERYARTFTTHAWRGAGFSAASFYQDVRAIIPRPLRPRIVAIQYASPGWMELSLLVGGIFALSRIVRTIIATSRAATDYYNHLYKQLYERKLTVIQNQQAELELLRKEHEFLKTSSDDFAKMLGITSIERLRELTGNELSTLKILLGYFRFARRLANRQIEGKAVLPEPPPPSALEGQAKKLPE
jgi:hypothetical protein